MNRFGIGRYCAIARRIKCRMTCLRVTLRGLEKFSESLVMTLLDGQHIRQSSLYDGF